MCSTSARVVRLASVGLKSSADSGRFFTSAITPSRVYAHASSASSSSDIAPGFFMQRPFPRERAQDEMVGCRSPGLPKPRHVLTVLHNRSSFPDVGGGAAWPKLYGGFGEGGGGGGGGGGGDRGAVSPKKYPPPGPPAVGVGRSRL